MDSGGLLFDRHRRGGVLVLGTGRDSTLLGWGSEIGNKRARSFFTSPEELLEEEYYYDEQTPEKKRRLTPEQVDLLEKSFEEENKLEPERKSELAKKLGVQPRQVAVWFQNRRARWKTKQLEHDFDRLKASYDALLADHHTVLKDNDHLRSQVMLLKDKLQAAESMVLTVENNASSSSEGLAIVHTDLKAEDSLSARGGGSPALPECGTQQFILSRADSNFPDSYQELGCPVGCEEDDSCDYLPEVLEQQQADALALLGTGWWVWS